MVQSTMPRLAAKAVLFDMDMTLVTDRSCANGHGDPFRDALREQVALQRSLSLSQADAAIAAAGTGRDLLALAEALGLDGGKYIDAVAVRSKCRIGAHADAVAAVLVLHGRGFRLAPATANPRCVCLVKLQVAGLAEGAHSPWFPELFGGGEVHPDGKTTPAFYTAILERLELAADEVVMVGDDPHDDGVLAQQAGIAQVVLVDREQAESWVVHDGAVVVNSLRLLPGMVGLMR